MLTLFIQAGVRPDALLLGAVGVCVLGIAAVCLWPDPAPGPPLAGVTVADDDGQPE